MAGAQIRVGWRASLDLTGRVLVYLAGPLAAPLVLALYYRESVAPFLVAIAVTVGLGAVLLWVGDRNVELGAREAFLAVSLIWLLIAAVGAIPFVVAGVGVFSVADYGPAAPLHALFEAMSGLTTTGATVLEEFSIHSESIMMWRQIIQWLGGLGILVLATAVLSSLGVGGAQLMESEKQTDNVDKLTPRISETARLIWGLYVGITALAAVTYFALGRLLPQSTEMDLYNAVAHALTSVATAGFSPEPLSAGAFAPAVQWAIVLFMILGSTSFILLYYAVTGDPVHLLRNEEFRFYLGSLAALSAVAVLVLAVTPDTGFAFEQRIRHAVFNVTSVLTTTGYASTDFTAWAGGAKLVLLLAMFLGGMVGSTTCSIKSLRWLVVLKSLRRNLFTAARPSAVRPVRVSDSPVEEETIKDVYAYILLSIVIFTLLSVVVIVDANRAGTAVSQFEAMGAAASTFLNIGPAFGDAGPYGNYTGFAWPTKTVMIVLMWIGRIEIIPVLVLFTKAFWTS